ncbi:cyclin-dependent kinase inhibitor 1 isoform X2 [Brachyhypopomus gauderio]
MLMAFNKRILRSLSNGPTRRNLFGPVDREQLLVEYKDALHKDLEGAARRWGFDFVSEKPLVGGDFQWEGVPGARVPALYRACSVGGVPRRQGVKSTAVTASGVELRTSRSADEKENVPRTPEKHISPSQSLEKTPDKTRTLKRKQTNITDYYKIKQHIVETPRKSGQ